MTSPDLSGRVAGALRDVWRRQNADAPGSPAFTETFLAALAAEGLAVVEHVDYSIEDAAMAVCEHDEHLTVTCTMCGAVIADGKVVTSGTQSTPSAAPSKDDTLPLGEPSIHVHDGLGAHDARTHHQRHHYFIDPDKGRQHRAAIDPTPKETL